MAKAKAEAKNDPSSADYEPSEDEKKIVSNWLGRVRRAEETTWRKEFIEDLQKFRGYLYGVLHGDKTGQKLVRSNMIFSTIAGMIPHLYAKNPEVAVTPSKACPQEKLPLVKKFCQSAETVVRETIIDEAKLKKRAKANVRSTMTTSYGVMKMVFQQEYRGDPVIVRRIQDTQDNIAAIERLTKELKKEDDVTELAKKRDELAAQLKGLTSGNEIRMYKGFAIDRLRSEDFLILDESIAEFDEYLDASALGHLVWMTVEQYKSTFGHEPKGATKYNAPFAKPGETTSSTPGDNQKADEMYVCVVEIWDKAAQVVRTVAKGSNRWCREPYAPKHTSQRWYPFFILGFNLVEGRWRPISDIELLMGLQDEYNTTRTNYADVRQKAVPKRIFRKSGSLTENDIENMVNASNKDWIGVEGNPTVPISQDVMQLEGPKIDPQAYDVTLIRNDMDMAVGMSDAGRANLIKPKTATEAELMAQALMTRVEERRDANEDLMSEMMEAGLEIALRCFSKAEVQQIAGAEAEWPEAASVEEIFSMVSVGVRAGSSGRPNAAKDKEQWTQLLPVIKDTMTAVAELRAAGNFDMANAAVELLRETLRRFEERLDIDALIPPLEMGEDGKPIAQQQQQQQMMAQLAQMKEEMAKLQEELAKTQQALQKAQMAEQAKMVEAQERAQLESQRQAEKAQLESQKQAEKSAEVLAKEAAAQADAEREANLETQRIEAEDARHQREMDQKAEEARYEAFLNAAVTLMTAERAAQSAAREKEVEGEREAQSEAAASAKIEGIVGKIDKTMAALAATMEKMSGESAKRTQMVQGLLKQDNAQLH